MQFLLLFKLDLYKTNLVHLSALCPGVMLESLIRCEFSHLQITKVAVYSHRILRYEGTSLTTNVLGFLPL